MATNKRRHPSLEGGSRKGKRGVCAGTKMALEDSICSLTGRFIVAMSWCLAV